MEKASAAAEAGAQRICAEINEWRNHVNQPEYGV
jgi:hypothetical protein